MSTFKSFDIVYDKVPLEGTYEYLPAETATDLSPSWPADAIVCTLCVQGTSYNILDIVDKLIVEHIEDILLERNQE